MDKLPQCQRFHAKIALEKVVFEWLNGTAVSQTGYIRFSLCVGLCVGSRLAKELEEQSHKLQEATTRATKVGKGCRVCRDLP